ncbi:MAG: permease [Gemmatimonadota bacterium]|nr:MAG: permease [Gemmatimonadota bacterium]
MDTADTDLPSTGAPSTAAPPTVWAREWRALVVIVGVFLLCFYLPVEWLSGLARLPGSVWEGLYLVRWYAQEHLILCLIPAFFIAGAISVFVSQASVLKYLGAGAKKVVAYGVASVSGALLAVCSCTVLPLFAGIYGMGAGLGPASAFLYAGPAINVLAIIFTARVLGLELGIARAVGAIVFSVVIGLFMHFIFRKEEMEKAKIQARMPEPEVKRPLWQNALFFASLVGVLVFANWGEPAQQTGLWYAVYSVKWVITSVVASALAVILVRWFDLELWKVAAVVVPTAVSALLLPGQPLIPFAVAVIGLSLITSTRAGESGDWFAESWRFAKQILPLLLAGVLIAGILLGRPGQEGLIPSAWVSGAVGGNSLFANFFASIAGALMYFATLTEVPILQGLIGNGMGAGPALALLLAGPALSLPNMLVIRSVIGTRKTAVYVALVVVMSTVAGLIYGTIHG